MYDEYYQIPDDKEIDINLDLFSYKKEEKQKIKRHIISSITKYFNTSYVKLNNRNEIEEITFDKSKATINIPLAQLYGEQFVGAANYILYIIASPYICNIIINNLKSLPQEERLIQLLTLCNDDRFYNVYLLNKVCHNFNLNCSKNKTEYSFETEYSFDSNTKLNNPILKKLINVIKSSKLKMEYMFDENINGIDSYTIFTNRIPETLIMAIKSNQEFIQELEKIYNRLVIILQTVVNFLNKRPINLYEKNLLEIMEYLSPFYILYFKGGNSIIKIFEKFNNTCVGYDEKFKIPINNIISYGSDFDTNILISPYLNNKIYNEIHNIIELFIPQISQFIKFPKKFLEAYNNPNEEFMKIFEKLLINKKENFEEQYMNIILNSYEKFKDYLYKGSRIKASKFILNSRDKKILKMIPEKKKDFTVKTIVLEKNDSKIIKRNILTFPNSFRLSDSTKILPEPKNDYCLDCLQLNINKTIDEFTLFRFFIKFKFDDYLEYQNPTSRLISLNNWFNAEILDISIVKNIYINKFGKSFCEGIELWNNILDLYKEKCEDSIGIIQNLKNIYNVNLIQEPGKTEYKYLLYFCNGIHLQYNDLLVTISDNIKNKDTAKLDKRLIRFNTLCFVGINDITNKNLNYYYDYYYRLDLFKLDIPQKLKYFPESSKRGRFLADIIYQLYNSIFYKSVTIILDDGTNPTEDQKILLFYYKLLSLEDEFRKKYNEDSIELYKYTVTSFVAFCIDNFLQIEFINNNNSIKSGYYSNPFKVSYKFRDTEIKFYSKILIIPINLNLHYTKSQPIHSFNENTQNFLLEYIINLIYVIPNENASIKVYNTTRFFLIELAFTSFFSDKIITFLVDNNISLKIYMDYLLEIFSKKSKILTKIFYLYITNFNIVELATDLIRRIYISRGITIETSKVPINLNINTGSMKLIMDKTSIDPVVSYPKIHIPIISEIIIELKELEYKYFLKTIFLNLCNLTILTRYNLLDQLFIDKIKFNFRQILNQTFIEFLLSVDSESLPMQERFKEFLDLLLLDLKLNTFPTLINNYLNTRVIQKGYCTIEKGYYTYNRIGPPIYNILQEEYFVKLGIYKKDMYIYAKASEIIERFNLNLYEQNFNIFNDSKIVHGEILNYIFKKFTIFLNAGIEIITKINYYSLSPLIGGKKIKNKTKQIKNKTRNQKQKDRKLSRKNLKK